MSIPDNQCPAECSRERLDWTVFDQTGAKIDGPTTLRTFVLPASDSYVGFVGAAKLSSGNIGLTMTLCEGPPSRSCNGEYGVFTQAGAPVGSKIDLYRGFYGDLTIARNDRTNTLLVS
jgi:hypothetical protein